MEELNIEILYHINNYESFIFLNSFDKFKKILDSRQFWINLFTNILGDTVKYIDVNFNNIDIYYLSSCYIKSVSTYNLCKNYLEKLKFDVNKDGKDSKGYTIYVHK